MQRRWCSQVSRRVIVTIKTMNATVFTIRYNDLSSVWQYCLVVYIGVSSSVCLYCFTQKQTRQAGISQQQCQNFFLPFVLLFFLLLSVSVPPCSLPDPSVLFMPSPMTTSSICTEVWTKLSPQSLCWSHWHSDVIKSPKTKQRQDQAYLGQYQQQFTESPQSWHPTDPQHCHHWHCSCYHCPCHTRPVSECTGHSMMLRMSMHLWLLAWTIVTVYRLAHPQQQVNFSMSWTWTLHIVTNMRWCHVWSSLAHSLRSNHVSTVYNWLHSLTPQYLSEDVNISTCAVVAS